jgi:RHH-type transcriptional regulator, rel operon repressor / antitoxin RelB
MSQDTITLQLQPEQSLALDQMALHLGCDRAELVQTAISDYISHHQWQTQHILEGIRQADQGDFATDAEVAQAFAKWRS